MNGPKGAGNEALKLAVMELVSRDVLKLIEREEGTVLERGSEWRETAPRPLGVVLEPFTDRFDGEERIEVSRLLGEIENRCGSVEGYVENEVMPSLENRGLYEKKERRILGLFPTTRRELTHSGEAMKAQLEQSKRLGEDRFGDWVVNDRDRALDYLTLIGPAILLMPFLQPDIQQLNEEEGDGGIYPGVSGGEAGGEGFLPDLDLGVLGGLEDLSSTIDSGLTGLGESVSSGGWFDGGGSGDGGGDFGGGGDGGGGAG
ncbi:MAG: hypothetical protein ACRDSJ_11795 [Rubrobacteraceae bacterium]